MSLFPDKRSNGMKRVPYKSLVSELTQSLAQNSEQLIISDRLEKVQLLTSVGQNAYYTREVFPVIGSLWGKKVKLIGDGPDIKVLDYFFNQTPLEGSGYYNYALLGDRLGVKLTPTPGDLLTEEDMFAAEALLRYPLAQILFQAFQIIDPQQDSVMAKWELVTLMAVLAFLECDLQTPFVDQPNKQFMGGDDVETIVNVFWELHRGQSVSQSYDQAFKQPFHLYLQETCNRFSFDLPKIKKWLEKQRQLEMFVLGRFSGDQPVSLTSFLPNQDLQPVLAEGVIFWMDQYASKHLLTSQEPLLYDGKPVSVMSHLLELKPLVLKSITLDNTTLWYKMKMIMKENADRTPHWRTV